MNSTSAVPDVLEPGLRVIFCGINPGRVSAAAGAHFANPRNDFWRLLHAAGFTPRLLDPGEQFEAPRYGIGLTNAAFRTTPGSGDLRRADFAGAAERLERIAHDLSARRPTAARSASDRSSASRSVASARRCSLSSRRRRRRMRRWAGRRGWAGSANCGVYWPEVSAARFASSSASPFATSSRSLRTCSSPRLRHASSSSGLIVPFFLFRFILVLQDRSDVVDAHADVGEGSHDSEHLAAVDPHFLGHREMLAARGPQRKMAGEARSSRASGS
ncbi:MAG: mismatch-specific DNA-glycosylase [Actinobacteria bacterium]|nr:MAG: mismatch-specific DNA-glycosylase [Actinomycetota bacterium]